MQSPVNAAPAPALRRHLSMNGALVHVNPRRRTVITVSIMMASIMQVLDTTIANVALPHIQGSLSATQDQIAWVLTSYIVASAIMTPLTGWLAGRVGRKRVLLVSIAGFTLSSMLCGLAQSLPQLVLARLLQGACGAAVVPMAQAVMLDINAPARQIRAMSIWSMAITIGPIAGPALGGWLTESYNWRWVFYINVPFGVLSFMGILGAMDETNIKRSSFDFFGFAALSLAVGALQITLDRGQLMDWFNSTEICVEAVVAVLALYLFIVHMLTTRNTRFLEPALFKDRNCMAGCIFIFTVGLILYATLALLPPLLQGLMGYPVITTGLVTAPRGFGSLAAMLLIGRIAHRLDMRWVICIGFGFAAFSAWQMTRFNLQMDASTVMWSGIAQGIGSGLISVPLAGAAFATLSPTLRNEGAALYSLFRNLGSSVGISVVEALLTRNTEIVHATLVGHLTPYSALIRDQIPQGIANVRQLAALNAQVTQQAAMVAYDDNFKLMMWLALAAIPAVLLLRRATTDSTKLVGAESTIVE
jgi:DHA2 family multidrug resistance protein